MSSHVRDYLEEQGPALSSDIIERFRAQGVSYAAARKRIQRAKKRSGIASLFALRLPHNDSFLYLERQYGDGPFWESLIASFERSGSAYGHAVHGLAARGGVALESEFPVLSGSPFAMKKQLSADTVLSNLKKVGLLQVESITGLGEVITFNPESSLCSGLNANHLRARLIADSILHRGIRDWARKISLVSYNKVETSLSDGNPDFGRFKWNLTAPSYTHPLVVRDTDEKPIPGFVVADAFVSSRELSAKEVCPFARKCEIMRSLPNTNRFMGLFVSGGFTEEALRVGANEGLLFSTLENLLGREIGHAMRDLVNTLSRAAEVAVENPQKVQTLMNQLSKIEGAAQNLRGPLFEMIVAHCLNTKEGFYVDVGKKVRRPETGESTEVDVLAVKHGIEVRTVECKGKKAGGAVKKGVVEDWLTRQVPRAVAWIDAQERLQGVQKKVEIWTTGDFSPKAVEYLRERKRKTKRYDIGWKDGDDVLEYVRSANATALVETLQEHYFDHALTRV